MTALPSTLRWLIIALLAVATLMLARQSHAQDRVTAADVANAVRNSPNASPWLRANADAVGSLAMFESGGRLGIYNGSCCYGVLQLNTQNIKDYADVKPAVFQTWSLQQQVDDAGAIGAAIDIVAQHDDDLSRRRRRMQIGANGLKQAIGEIRPTVDVAHRPDHATGRRTRGRSGSLGAEEAGQHANHMPSDVRGFKRRSLSRG